MNIAPFANRVRKVVMDNSPSILTGVAVAGVVSTAALASKASIGAHKNIEEDKSTQVVLYGENITVPVRYWVERNWKLYIPTVLVGGATIACIIGANSVNTRRNAALASLYSLTEVASREYKDKVVQLLGEKKEQTLRDELAQETVENNPVSENKVYYTGSGDVLCYETMSGRYFHSDMETLRKAQNDINAKILNEMYASQNDFNRLIGLPATGYGEQVGWNTDKMLELQFSSVLSEDGKPCLAIGYSNVPILNYYKIN